MHGVFTTRPGFVVTLCTGYHSSICKPYSSCSHVRSFADGFFQEGQKETSQPCPRTADHRFQPGLGNSERVDPPEIPNRRTQWTVGRTDPGSHAAISIGPRLADQIDAG